MSREQSVLPHTLNLSPGDPTTLNTKTHTEPDPNFHPDGLSSRELMVFKFQRLCLAQTSQTSICDPAFKNSLFFVWEHTPFSLDVNGVSLTHSCLFNKVRKL